MNAQPVNASIKGHLRGRAVGPIVATVALSTAVLIVLFLAWALWGIRTIRRTLVAEAERNAVALLESLSLAAQYSVAAGSLVDQLERETKADRALSLAQEIRPESATETDLADMASQNEIDGLTVWRQGQAPVTYPSRLDSIGRLDSVLAAHDWRDEPVAVLTLDDPSLASRWHGVGVRIEQGAVLLWEKADLASSRPSLAGIGELIQQIGARSGVSYIMLQSPEGIVLASRPLKPVLKLASDSFLVAVLESDSSATREIMFEDVPVLEAAAPFLSTELPSGMLRVGVSLAGVADAERRLVFQLGITAFLFLLLSTAVTAVLVTRRSLADLGRSYRRVETLTGRVLDTMDQAVIAVDRDHRITLMNPAAERLLGHSLAESAGKPVSETMGSEDFGLSEPIGVRDREMTRATPQGPRQLVYTSAPIADAEGAVTVISDQTEQRALAAQLRRQERLSEMGQMAASVAHEIRNPLNAIALAAQRLRVEAADPDAARLAATIWDEAQHLNVILEEFLSLARPSTQPKIRMDLAEIVAMVAEMAKLESVRSGVTLTLDVRGAQPMSGNPDELRKAVWNILANSLAATPSGGHIRVMVDRDGSHAVLTVDDTGTGIAADDLSKVFQPWFTTKPKGTGLGLAITHRIVTDHGGTITVMSPVPETSSGTRVVVRFPVVVADRVN